MFLCYLRPLFIFLITLFLSTPVSAQDWFITGKRGIITFVVVTKEREKDEKTYREAINSICLNGEFCKILFWSNKKDVPTSWPMTKDERNAIIADYFYNGNSGENKFYFKYGND